MKFEDHCLSYQLAKINSDSRLCSIKKGLVGLLIALGNPALLALLERLLPCFHEFY